MEKFGILIVRDLVQTSQALADGLSIKFPCRRGDPLPSIHQAGFQFFILSLDRSPQDGSPHVLAYEQMTTCVTAKGKARERPLSDSPTCDSLSQTPGLATATALCIFPKFGTQGRGNVSVNSDSKLRLEVALWKQGLGMGLEGPQLGSYWDRDW